MTQQQMMKQKQKQKQKQKMSSCVRLLVVDSTLLLLRNPTRNGFFSPLSTKAKTKKGCFVSSASGGGGGWLSSVFGSKKERESYPDVVKVGDPVLHEPAAEVNPDRIPSDEIQDAIDRMIQTMRKAPAVGLAAPQIGIPLKIIVLEDTQEYISYASKDEIKAQDRRPFDLLVIVNPKLKTKGDKTALFFEGCLSVDGYRALVERSVDVEVSGWDRDGCPTVVHAAGWQARILQHECDHLDGVIYVDRMIPRTFRTVENLSLPLPAGCPKLGVR